MSKALYLFFLVNLFSINQNGLSSQNLLTNGDFESGGNGVGFNINGFNYVQLTPPFSGTTVAGNYAITNNPQLMNTSTFISGGDHTTGSGNMLVVDGNTTGGSQRFWRAGGSGGGACGLVTGATYRFSYWIKSVSTTVTNAATRANIGYQIIGGNNITLLSGNAVAPLPADGWQQVIYTFTATNFCVNIELFDINTNGVGNDFAVDDFVLIQQSPLVLSYSAIQPSCPGSNDGSISVYATNGIPPYTIYNLSGTATYSNANGIFTGLGPGVYTASVTDSNPNTATIPAITLVDPPALTASADSSICASDSFLLNASGGSGTYAWTASPTDPTLTTTNTNATTVSPTQTTVYTVTSNTNTVRNLVYNGDFTQGNVGFTSMYSYFNPTNPSLSQRAYGIVSNPTIWEPGFSNCGDHTSGSGLMMVVDGSAGNSGNDLLWGQNIPVTPGQNYVFSYWIQSVVAVNPAVIKSTINGVVLGTGAATNSLCTWTNYTYTWNSGTSTLAQIRLFDQTTVSNGNDFAIDDLSFTTNINCNLTESVTLTVTPALSPIISCGTSTANSIIFNWTAVSGATSYSITYNINSGPTISGGNTTNLTYTLNSLAPSDSVTIQVIPTGSGCFIASNQTCTTQSTCTPPSTAAGSVTIQPSCLQTTGSIVLTSPIGLNYQYSANGGSFQANPTFSGLSPGPYSIIVKDISTGCLSSSPLLLTVNSAVTVAAPAGSITIQPTCAIPTGTAVISSPIGSNFQYSVNGNPYQFGTTFTGLVPGSYQLTVKNIATGCVSLPTNVVVNTITGAPILLASVTFQPTCVSATGTITVTAPIGLNYEYSSDGINYQSGPIFSGLIPGSYQMTVKNIATGCVSLPTNVVVNTIPGAPILMASVTFQPTCVSATGTITVSAPIGLNYEYSSDGINYQSGPIFSGLIPGSYSIKTRDLNNGCESAPLSLTVNPVPTLTNVSVSVTAQPSCINATGTIEIYSPLGANFEYSVNGFNFQSSPIFNGLTPDIYTVVIKNITNGCYNTSNLTVLPPATIANPITQVSQPTCSALGTIEALSPIGANLQYSINGTTFQWSPVFGGLSPGSYSVTVKNTINGCSANTSGVVLTATGLPDISASVTYNINCGATLQATSTQSGVSLTWMGPGLSVGTSNPVVVYQAGTYTATVTDPISNCSRSITVSVNILPTPDLVVNNPPTTCSPQTVDITAPSVTLGSSSGILTYWNDAAATIPLLSPSAISTSGIYYIQLENASGCQSISQVFVQINPFTPIIATTTVSDFFSDPFISVQTDGVGNYLYQLDSGLIGTASVFMNLESGLHTITIYDITNCSPPIQLDVTIVTFPPYFTPNGDGIHDSWNIEQLNNDAQIYIFDRYGKLLKQISPIGNGWDGTYQGQPMPSSDYWFYVRYKEADQMKDFRSHFTLKR